MLELSLQIWDGDTLMSPMDAKNVLNREARYSTFPTHDGAVPLNHFCPQYSKSAEFQPPRLPP